MKALTSLNKKSFLKFTKKVTSKNFFEIFRFFRVCFLWYVTITHNMNSAPIHIIVFLYDLVSKVIFGINYVAYYLLDNTSSFYLRLLDEICEAYSLEVPNRASDKQLKMINTVLINKSE